MLSGLLKVSGMLVLRLVYGKKYAEKSSEKFGLMLLLSLANVFWLMSILLLFAGSAAKDTALCVIMAIGYPIAIVIWAVMVRRNPTDKNNAASAIRAEKVKVSNASAEDRTVKNETTTSARATNIPDEIKRYKELLDVGAITQEEYEAKKKQLLGL